ncbi:hypothetical protein E2P81_ATG09107 [Venturia nashicola]|nr:hypothetical protein E2P81_ATG09107 [Venturia nashicola]
MVVIITNGRRSAAMRNLASEACNTLSATARSWGADHLCYMLYECTGTAALVFGDSHPQLQDPYMTNL